MAIDPTCQYGMKGLPIYGPVKLLDNHDLSTPLEVRYVMGNQSAAFPVHSYQLVWSGLTGSSLNGVAKLQSSNNCEDWCDTPELNGTKIIQGDLNTPAGSLFLVDPASFGANSAVMIDLGDITGGTLSIYAVAKP